MHLIIIRRKLLGLGLKERNGPPEVLSLSACGRYLGYLVDFSTRDWFYVLALFLVCLVPGGGWITCTGIWTGSVLSSLFTIRVSYFRTA